MQKSQKLLIVTVLSMATVVAGAQANDSNEGKAYVGFDFGYGQTAVDVTKESK